MIREHHGSELFIVIALIALITLFSVVTENFFSIVTLKTILSQLPALTTVTVAITLVLIVGGIDLSVGSVLGLSAVIVGITSASGDTSIGVACLLGVIGGFACGLLSGGLISYLSVPSFIVTLGMLEMARGLCYLLSGSQTTYIGASIQFLARPLPAIGLPVSLLIALLVVVFGHLVLTRTIFGRYLIAIGTNETAAKLSGINTRPYRASVFAISGALAGLAGVFNIAYLGAADPNAGIGMELAAIAAAVIGGTSLMGGRGSILGAFAGVLIIVVLQNGLAQLGATEPTKRLITGAVIIVAVLVDRIRTRTKA